jgi:hypothetical protein
MAARFLASSLGLLASLAAAATNGTDPFRQSCLSFQPQKHVYNATLTAREFVPANTTLAFPDNDPTCSRPSQLVSADICRIALSIPTSNKSSITYEMWLPREWSGRFLATGNGGIDGCMSCFPRSIRNAHGLQASSMRTSRTRPRTGLRLSGPTTVTMARTAMHSTRTMRW